MSAVTLKVNNIPAYHLHGFSIILLSYSTTYVRLLFTGTVGERKFPICLLSVCFLVNGCILRHTSESRPGKLTDSYALQKPDRSGLASMIWYHMTNTEADAFTSHSRSNVLCSQDDTDISLSTEVGGYGIGEWLHLCRLQV